MCGDNYILGILWSIGRMAEDEGKRYFFLRHQDRYFLDAAKQALGVEVNIYTVTHKGKPQYCLKISGFDMTPLEALGWRARNAEQRSYPRIHEHRDFIRAYCEIHSGVDTMTIRDRQSPRLRIYGNRAFLEQLAEALAAEAGVGVMKVQKATEKSLVSGILYYQGTANLEVIFSYLYRSPVEKLHGGYYESFLEILKQFK